MSDYVPFYFTPFSPMAYNIVTGHHSTVRRVPSDEIAILVASLLDLMRAGLSVLYTDRHAFLMTARFFDSLDNLDQIDWRPLRNRDFKRDNNDPGKIERYQAEALVHRHLPVGALRAILCYSENQRKRVEGWAAAATCSVPILTRRSFYF